MKTLKSAALVLLMVLMPACGQQLVEFEIDSGTTPVTDAGRTDSGIPDSGIPDSGIPDSGIPDSGIPDSGIPDSGIPDSGIPDSGVPDSGVPDSGVPDAGDMMAPTVTSTIPIDGAMSVSVGTTVNATFSEAMNPATLNMSTFTVMQGMAPVTGIVTYAGLTATFSPATLAASTTYTATIATGATDLAGNPLASNYVWTFTTGTIPDSTPPTVILTSPLDLAMNVSILKRLTATFSEPMDPLSISTTSFTLRQGLNPLLAGVVTYDAVLAMATFAPTLPLAVSTTYTATITTVARDLALNPMVNNYVWTFTTGACGQAPVVLGAAGAFVALAGSTVTNTGPTSITGDLGVSPGSSVTGFPPGIVVGTQHVTDPTAAAAEFDLTVAYNDAAGRTLCPIAVAGNLGGQTLTPGLYKSTGSLSITSGDLTLDAQGDPDAVFIFQIASTLDTTGGRQVILSGGAKAANVFWQVGTSATLGTTSAFIGTIMADQAITLNTGASLTGRALARIGAVNFDSNVVVKPAP
ncbi:MAG: ice-binding family protein [Archangium sp.]|nr:ice-binding family protein [Archangium sp.]